MRGEVFYRNHLEGGGEGGRKGKNGRHSMEGGSSPYCKGSLQLKKPSRRNSNLLVERKENAQPLRKKATPAATAKPSLNATKHNSPLKPSLATSQLLIPHASPRDYKFYYQIGFGAFGRVWKVAGRGGGGEWALKEISKHKVIEKGSAGSVVNERRILSELHHPLLINMHRAFQDARHLYLLMDYLRGADLRYHICYKDAFSQEEIRFIAACMVLALQHIHAHGIIHKDIKPENIVFEETGYPRLTDFGIAQHKDAENGQRGESSGTPVYMAPEILFRRDYSYESDFYALGVVIFELVMGRRPYQGKTRSEIREELMNKEICLGEFELPDGCSTELASLINQLLKKNPSERLGRNGIRELKEHVFFRTVKWRKLERKEVKPPFVPNVVCETQGYLSEIALFNEMNQQCPHPLPALDSELDAQFATYHYDREEERKAARRAQLRKMRRASQTRV